jgi:transketolase
MAQTLTISCLQSRGYDDSLLFPMKSGLLLSFVGSRIQAARFLALVAAQIGGSADLDPSTHTVLKGLGDFELPKSAAFDKQGWRIGAWRCGAARIRIHRRQRLHASDRTARSHSLISGFQKEQNYVYRHSNTCLSLLSPHNQ